MGDGGQADGTAPFRLSSCTTDCPDCAGTGRVGLTACTRPTQWLRRVGWSYWADVLSDRRAA